MAVILHFADHNGFEPGEIAAMSQALEEACTALQVRAGDHRTREIVATRIVDLARTGVIDARSLRDRVLLEAATKG